MTQIIVKTFDNQLQVHQPYFAALRDGIPLDVNYNPIFNPRSTVPKIAYKRYGRFCAEVITLTHKLTNADDLFGRSVLPGGATINTQLPIVIDGIPVEIDDIIEIDNTVASAIGCASGRWLAETTTRIIRTNSPRFIATTADTFGGKPWRFRVLADGTLSGLILATANITSSTNLGTTSTVSGMLRPFDNNMTTFADMLSLNTGQGFKVVFDPITPVRIEMMCDSVRQSKDRVYPSAKFTMKENSLGNIDTWFKHSNTDLRANWGPYVWSKGNQEWYYSDELKVTFNDLQVNDAGGSRARLFHFGFLIDGPGRIKIGNTFPELGSIIEIPEIVSNAMKPPQLPGDYIVVNNDGVNPWQIKQV